MLRGNLTLACWLLYFYRKGNLQENTQFYLGQVEYWPLKRQIFISFWKVFSNQPHSPLLLGASGTQGYVSHVLLTVPRIGYSSCKFSSKAVKFQAWFVTHLLSHSCTLLFPLLWKSLLSSPRYLYSSPLHADTPMSFMHTFQFLQATEK